MVTCTDRGDLCFWPPDEDKVSTIDSGHHDQGSPLLLTEPVPVMFVRDFLSFCLSGHIAMWEGVCPASPDTVTSGHRRQRWSLLVMFLSL